VSSTLPIVETSSTLVVLDLVGIFVFAISGALVAVRKDLDVFGVLILAGTTGLGGGFLRDVLIDATPPTALVDWRYLLVPVAAGLLTFWFHPALGRMERTITVFDAFGLGLFCVTGALKSLDYGLGPVPAALMGMVTGIGGGMARDVLASRVPAVSRCGDAGRLRSPRGPPASDAPLRQPPSRFSPTGSWNPRPIRSSNDPRSLTLTSHVPAGTTQVSSCTGERPVFWASTASRWPSSHS
jgi:uncharacterized membrane protein YeiH